MTTTRRSFLKAGTAAALAAASYQRVLGANDVLRIGCIGTGGRCRHLMKSLVTIPKTRIDALCDVWDVSLAEAKKLAGPNATTTKRFADILSDREIDAVLIGTPDHWHVPISIAACEAGKHVYVEKPLTHSLEEGAAVVSAHQKSKVKFQVGTQQRSMPHIQRARALVKTGRLGQITKVHLTWNRNTDRVRRFPLGVDPKSVDWKAFLGNAKDQPFDEYRFRNWRWYWDFGGGILTDLMVHWIDVAHWILELDHPLEALTLGQYPAAKDVWETPDTIQTLLKYPNDLQVHFEGTFSNAHGGAHILFMGTQATLYVDRGRMELTPERGKGQPEELILGTGKRGADFYDKPNGEQLHLINWIDAIHQDLPTNCPAADGVSSAAAAHLGNQSFRIGQIARWKA